MVFGSAADVDEGGIEIARGSDPLQLEVASQPQGVGIGGVLPTSQAKAGGRSECSTFAGRMRWIQRCAGVAVGGLSCAVGRGATADAGASLIAPDDAAGCTGSAVRGAPGAMPCAVGFGTDVLGWTTAGETAPANGSAGRLIWTCGDPLEGPSSAKAGRANSAQANAVANATI